MSEENVAIVRTMHEAFAEMNFARIRDALDQRREPEATADELGRLGRFLLDHVDPDVEIVQLASSFSLPDMQLGSKLRGWEGFAEFWRRWLEPWERFEYEPRNFLDVGENVVMDNAVTAQGRESGLVVNLTFSQVWTLRDGRVTRLQTYDTRAEALEAAGLRE